jgi:hypothetical protein
VQKKHGTALELALSNSFDQNQTKQQQQHQVKELWFFMVFTMGFNEMN